MRLNCPCGQQIEGGEDDLVAKFSPSPTEPRGSDVDQREKNKQVVARMFDVIYGPGDDIDVLDEIVAEDYIQHNPMAGQGRGGR